MPSANDAWKKDNTTIVRARLMNSSEECQALLRAVEQQSTTLPQYLKKALRNQLIRDGYLQED